MRYAIDIDLNRDPITEANRLHVHLVKLVDDGDKGTDTTTLIGSWPFTHTGLAEASRSARALQAALHNVARDGMQAAYSQVMATLDRLS